MDPLLSETSSEGEKPALSASQQVGKTQGKSSWGQRASRRTLSCTSALLPAQRQNLLLQEALPVPPGRRNLSPQQSFLGSLLCHLGLSPIQLAKGNFLPLTKLLQGKDHIRFRPVSPRHVEDALGLLNGQVKWLDPVPNPDKLVNWSGDETWSMEVKNYGPEAAVLIGIPAGLLAPCPWKIPFPWSLGDARGLAQLKHSRNDRSYYHQHHYDFSRDKGNRTRQPIAIEDIEANTFPWSKVSTSVPVSEFPTGAWDCLPSTSCFYTQESCYLCGNILSPMGCAGNSRQFPWFKPVCDPGTVSSPSWPSMWR